MKPARVYPEINRIYPETYRRGFAQIIIVAVIVLVLGAIAMFGYQKYSITHQDWVHDEVPVTTDEINSTISARTSDETANWKIYTTDNYSIKYPPEWITGYEPAATFKSKDYSVKILVWGEPFDDKDPSLVSTKETFWKGQKATLQVHKYKNGHSALLLTAKLSDLLFFQMDLTAVSDEVRNRAEALFLRVSETIQVH